MDPTSVRFDDSIFATQLQQTEGVRVGKFPCIAREGTDGRTWTTFLDTAPCRSDRTGSKFQQMHLGLDQ